MFRRPVALERVFPSLALPQRNRLRRSSSFFVPPRTWWVKFFHAILFVASEVFAKKRIASSPSVYIRHINIFLGVHSRSLSAGSLD